MDGDQPMLTGFRNEHATEALPGALPEGQNTPQRCAYGLYAEQLSGTAFTRPRAENLRTWLYRIRPSVVHGRYTPMARPSRWRSAPLPDAEAAPPDPNQMRWDPVPVPEPSTPTDFVDGMTTLIVNGSGPGHAGMAGHVYVANRSMSDSRRVLTNADGELLLVPEHGRLRLMTECGRLDVGPGHVALVPRGMKVRVDLIDATARGYVCENHGATFRLPDLGPIGANGLANPRDFEAPVAAYEDAEGDWTSVMRFQGTLWEAPLGHSPFDVVAWHGNLAPYRYDLARFNTMNTVSFDHPDPSIFTVLTSPTAVPGRANVDFVIFPPRWTVGEHTFRPPYYHRNVMSEFMGLVTGVYDAKAEGFQPGGASLHNMMTAHGPDAATFEAASHAELAPQRYRDTLAFMFESCLPFQTTAFARSGGLLQDDYLGCWRGLVRHFEPPA